MAPAEVEPSQPDLILASTSVYRRGLLERLGIPFRSRAPLCDEPELQRASSGLRPRALAELLALAKATSLVREEPGGTIIGCDQVVSFEGRIFGKAGDIPRAIDQLEAMAGRTHELITATAVLRGERTSRHTDITRLRMRPLTREEIERYVAADHPIDCAGSYKLESGGIALFDRIESEDHTAVIGLPLIALVTILRDLGYAIP